MQGFIKLVFISVIFVLLIFLSLSFYNNGLLEKVLLFLKPFGFLPEFLAGMLYTSFLTAPISVAALFILSRFNSPLVIALVAGLGSMIADLVIFKFFRYLLFGKSSPIASNEIIRAIVKSLRTSKIFRKFAPIIGGIIIASPLPDELGLMVLGVTNIKTGRVALLTYSLNTVGILVISQTASVLP
ncbi:hypothetical protein HYS93_03990 [Candidatus Daviesbacteria bacterium]|nr:hypothetical protein [Candidatus Daviesbacteria bacterium]